MQCQWRKVTNHPNECLPNESLQDHDGDNGAWTDEKWLNVRPDSAAITLCFFTSHPFTHTDQILLPLHYFCTPHPFTHTVQILRTIFYTSPPIYTHAHTHIHILSSFSLITCSFSTKFKYKMQVYQQTWHVLFSLILQNQSNPTTSHCNTLPIPPTRPSPLQKNVQVCVNDIFVSLSLAKLS